MTCRINHVLWTKLPRKTDRKLLCTGCQIVIYCSPLCQREDWKSHKETCSKLSQRTACMFMSVPSSSERKLTSFNPVYKYPDQGPEFAVSVRDDFLRVDFGNTIAAQRQDTILQEWKESFRLHPNHQTVVVLDFCIVPPYQYTALPHEIPYLDQIPGHHILDSRALHSILMLFFLSLGMGRRRAHMAENGHFMVLPNR